MLWSMQTMRGYSVRATDGRLGSVVDFLFDDAHWIVRYMVVDTAWLFGRRVLIATSALGRPDEATAEITVDLTEEQVKNSPDVDTDRPVSRQAEADLHTHYGWIPYWAPGKGGLGVLPTAGVEPPVGEIPVMGRERPIQAAKGDPHLRSEREVRGYDIKATDGEIGEVDDFLIDGTGWTIRYMVADIGSWFSGKRVLLSPDWITHIDWPSRTMTVSTGREQVKAAPPYESAATFDRSGEEGLYRHFRQTVYWE